MTVGFAAPLPGCPLYSVAVCGRCHAAGREADPNVVTASVMALITRDLCIEPDVFLTAWEASGGRWPAFAQYLGVSLARLDRALAAATAPPPGVMRVTLPRPGPML